MLKEQLLQITKPILFNTEMVKAILEGRKTQTRRIVGDKIFNEIYKYDCYIEDGKIFESCMCQGMPDGSGGLEVDIWEQDVTTTYSKYKIGDILYVRETWNYDEQNNKPYYKADFDLGSANALGMIWKPSIHMPKKYARIFLKVTNIRVEKLSDMDERDLEKEGFEYSLPPFGKPKYIAYKEFDELWDLTVKDGYKVKNNPYVFVYEFERVEVC